MILGYGAPDFCFVSRRWSSTLICDSSARLRSRGALYPCCYWSPGGFTKIYKHFCKHSWYIDQKLIICQKLFVTFLYGLWTSQILILKNIDRTVFSNLCKIDTWWFFYKNLQKFTKVEGTRSRWWSATKILIKIALVCCKVALYKFL